MRGCSFCGTVRVGNDAGRGGDPAPVSAPESRARELDDLVATPVEDGLQHEEAEPLCLLGHYLGAHDELLLRRRHVDEGWTRVRECLAQSPFDLIRVLDADALDASRLGDGSKV